MYHTSILYELLLTHVQHPPNSWVTDCRGRSIALASLDTVRRAELARLGEVGMRHGGRHSTHQGLAAGSHLTVASIRTAAAAGTSIALLFGHDPSASQAGPVVSGKAVFVSGPCGAQSSDTKPCTSVVGTAAGLRFTARSSRDGRVIQEFSTGDDGSFSIRLPTGEYVIGLALHSLHLSMRPVTWIVAPSGASNLSLNVVALRP